MPAEDKKRETDPFAVSQSAVTGVSPSNFYASLPSNSRQSFIKLLADNKAQQNPYYIRGSSIGLKQPMLVATASETDVRDDDDDEHEGLAHKIKPKTFLTGKMLQIQTQAQQ